MGKEEEHVRERDAFARFMRYTSLVVQPVVQVLPPLDSSAVDAAKYGFRLVEIVSIDNLLNQGIPILWVFRDGH